MREGWVVHLGKFWHNANVFDIHLCTSPVSYRSLVHKELKNTHHNLDNLVQARSGLLENRFRIPDDGLRFLRHRPGNQIALCICGDLAREPDMAGSFDGLGLSRSAYFSNCKHMIDVRSVQRLYKCLH